MHSQVMEYCPGGNLTTLMSAHDFSDEAVALVVAQGGLAINAVHSHGFAHR